NITLGNEKRGLLMLLDQMRQPGLDIVDLGFVMVVDAHEFQRREQEMRDIVLFEKDRKQLSGQEFALGEDVLAQRFAEGNAQNDMQEFEVLRKYGFCLGIQWLFPHKLFDKGLVMRFQLVDEFTGSLPVSGRNGISDLHKGIG